MTKAALAGSAPTLTEGALAPLRALAAEARQPRPILMDSAAGRLLESLGATFVPPSPTRQLGYALRAWLMDSLVRGYLEKQPDGLVIECGGGLSTRFQRLDNGRCRWHIVDAPPILAHRSRELNSSGRLSVTTGAPESLAWIADIDPEGPPPLVVAEGILWQWSEDQVKALLTKLADLLPGCSLLYDTLTPLARRWPALALLEEGQTPLWTTPYGKSLEDWSPRFEPLERIPVWSIHQARWPWRVRYGIRLWRSLARVLTVHLIRLNRSGQ